MDSISKKGEKGAVTELRKKLSLQDELEIPQISKMMRAVILGQDLSKNKNFKEFFEPQYWENLKDDFAEEQF